jgi:hypothetical protein
VRAQFVWANPLFLKPCAQKVFTPFLEERFPAMARMYRERYAERAYLPAQYQQRITNLVRKLCDKYMIHRTQNAKPKPAGGSGERDFSAFLQQRARAEERDQQLSLF